MKNRQTTLFLLLALLLTSPLVSCSAGNEAPPSTDNTQTTMEQTVEETETARQQHLLFFKEVIK